MYTVRYNEYFKGWGVVNLLGWEVAQCNGGDKGLTQAEQKALRMNEQWLSSTVTHPNPSLPQRALRIAAREIDAADCILLRNPKGGWWVTPKTGGPAFQQSMTRSCDTLQDAIDAANRIEYLLTMKHSCS